jgi:rRNA maturation endonuclease Nob1
LDRLKSHLITLEAERDSAQNQALLLHNEAERQRKELENAHLTSTAQSEELDRLKSHLITLEAERDNLLIHKVEVDNVIEKSRVSLQSLSFELLEKSRQAAKLMEENENLSTEVRELSEHISSLSDHFSARNLAAQNRITGLEQSLQRMAAQLGVELVNLRVKQQEIELIRSSRGYRLLSWIWRRKS